MWPRIECEEGYPLDESLDAFRKHKFTLPQAALFLVEGLPRVAEGISCCSVRVTDSKCEWLDQPEKHVEFHTGGWSGAESLIEAVLSHFWIHYLHSMWKRGGHFYFEVPGRLLAQAIEARRAETAQQAPSPDESATPTGDAPTS